MCRIYNESVLNQLEVKTLYECFFHIGVFAAVSTLLPVCISGGQA